LLLGPKWKSRIAAAGAIVAAVMLGFFFFGGHAEESGQNPTLAKRKTHHPPTPTSGFRDDRDGTEVDGEHDRGPADGSLFASRGDGTSPPGSTRRLRLDKTGSGKGAVTSAPPGIECGPGCSHGYPRGAIVTLTATPDGGSFFDGWSGACEGTGPCLVTMESERVIVARFAKRPDRIGVFRPGDGTWYLDRDGDGEWSGCERDECRGPFGMAGDLPAVGNWTGLGNSTIGVFRPSSGAWAFDTNGDGKWSGPGSDTVVESFGLAIDWPVVGDWYGLGIDSIGVYRPATGEWFLDTNGNGVADGCTVDECAYPFGVGNLGRTDLIPVVGDWIGSGKASIGLYGSRDGAWYVDSLANLTADFTPDGDWYYTFGIGGDRPVVGDWTGSGVTRIGVFRPQSSRWYLDLDGNGAWDGCEVDACLGPFGASDDIPVVGRW